MISVATSVWVAFLQRRPEVEPLIRLLEGHAVEIHPFVLGELELGKLGPRQDQLLTDLEKLASITPQSHGDVRTFIRQHGLASSGLGYVDAHVLSSAYAGGHLVWSLDAEISELAEKIGIAFKSTAGARH